ncbi:hypothetical protein LLG96_16275 [bacterium]|nr:hypothetical protein [bacterium]
MKKTVLMAVLAVYCLAGCSSDDKARTKNDAGQPGTGSYPVSTADGKTIPVAELAKWPFYGIGNVSIDQAENALRVAESDSSKGVMLVSPESYASRVVVSFKVKPSTFESVNVVVISASDKTTGGDFLIPSDYDGNFGFWTQENVQNYVFAFHNAAHDRKPFIVRDPGMVLLAEAETHVTGERWNEIEIGRDGSHVFMKIDGKTIIDAADTAQPELPGGKICFRLRGTPGNNASALFKDVVIREQ